MVRRPLVILTALLPIVLAGQAAAQNNNLRGLTNSSPNRLPSAQQQLNQNLNQQKSDFSTRRQLEGANKLNRTDQINRLNTRPDTSQTPCPAGNEACRERN
ncbi:MAG: hypothetical protein ABJG32_17530 [Roseibium sp.]